MTSRSTSFSLALSPSNRSLFEQRLVHERANSHEMVVNRGDTVSGAFFVLQGVLRVFTISANGREADLYRIEPGGTCVLALNSLFNDLLYPAWVQADEDTEFGILPGDVYRTLFATEPAIQDLTIKALSSAVFGLMSSLEARSSQNVEQRLVGFLLLIASSKGLVHRTQQDIADSIGTTREVVGKHMARLSKDGLVKTQRGVITLLDLSGLQNISESDC